MEIRQLKTFWTLASTCSFSQTAELLSYVPSTITMQIKSLEEELGVKLLDRLGKKVVLTDAGQQFLPYATKILNDVEEAKCISSQHGELAGTVVIGADEVLCAYLLPALFKRFRADYPGVRLLFRPLSGQELKSSLREGHADVVFVLDEPINSKDLQSEFLKDETFQMVVSPDHMLASRSALVIDDFHKQHFLLTEKNCSYRTYFDQSITKKGADALTELEFHSVEAIKQCVVAGLGIALLPEMALKKELSDGEVVALPWDLSDVSFSAQMLWHREKWISPSMAAFMEVAKSELI
ncbi:LysR family transcriptional regulator [Paenibacillus xylanexedens]|uniref:LysR family transcriptional regulator n=1 Tax=Paenibacillus TaxID=44249 RepID=UPI0003E21DD5|nr:MULTISPECIES: LysR family transcriptional regulator [Paenibacillus]ETT43892.1 LysR family transcriptional regulator [Paenibacillus sp. FSL H7-689]MCF7754415.1 LysR family transcriptional regulator [Paenibacillus xylanexedens]